MRIHLVFLVKLNMAAHDNDGLAHQKHKKSPDQCQCKQEQSAAHDQLRKIKPSVFENANTPLDQWIKKDLFGRHGNWIDCPLHFIYHIACHLWRQYTKVVGQ